MEALYWVGPRESDILDTGSLFKGSVTIYGSNQNGNIAYCRSNKTRINHNLENEDCDLFFVTTLEQICKMNSKSLFLFYNSSFAYKYGKTILEHTICLNSETTLDILSDKAKCKYILTELVNTIPFVTLYGNECEYDNLCGYFQGYSKFIIQQIHSSGGEGTYFVGNNTDVGYILNENYEGNFIVSPYIENSISLNIHIAIFDNDVQLLPPSVQIIKQLHNKLLYQGADYVCYETLDKQIKSEVNKSAKVIGKFLLEKGYRGILGVDFLVKDQIVYFTEINPRFQASSPLINKVLYTQYHTSLQEIQLQANNFLHTINKIDSFTVPYSCFFYTTSTITAYRLRKIRDSLECQLATDGFDISDNFPNEKDIYLCKCIFNQNICSMQNNHIILHPNIFVEDIKEFINRKQNHYREYTKIALLNHGLTLTESACIYTHNKGTIKKAVFDAIDITIWNSLHINVPITCKLVSLSPFSIDCIEGRLRLYLDEEDIGDITIDFIPNSLKNRKTKSGVPYESVIHLATDRIRINPASICIYKKQNIPCEFCNLPEQNCDYTLSDIKEIIDYCLENVSFRHFLIGGGTYSQEGGWDVIIEIVHYIRNKCEKDIYLMAIPPHDINVLNCLKSAGITEVAFNLEMFDRQKARVLMPGKGYISIEQYDAAFEQSVELWGRNGQVRSLLILGLDSNEVFLKGIENLCQRGIEPIISIFRPLENTAMFSWNPPETAEIIYLYDQCQKIVKKYSLILGPDCPECQNNTLSYTEIS